MVTIHLDKSAHKILKSILKYHMDSFVGKMQAQFEGKKKKLILFLSGENDISTFIFWEPKLMHESAGP